MMNFWEPHQFQLWKPNRIQQWYANQLEVRLNPLNWLQQWYSDQLCHHGGNCVDISIETQANPAWRMEINLKGTALEAVPFKEIKIDRSDHEWFFYRVREGEFIGSGDTFKFFEILQTYQDWVTSTGSIVNVDDTRNRHLLLQWLQEWFCSQCDGSWEEAYGVTILTDGNQGWKLNIDIEQTELEACSFEALSIYHSEQDWLQCSVKDFMFQGTCAPLNLTQLLEVFRTWAEDVTLHP
jgi:hypothetical protein